MAKNRVQEGVEEEEVYMEIFMVKSSMSKQSHTQYKVHRL